MKSLTIWSCHIVQLAFNAIRVYKFWIPEQKLWSNTNRKAKFWTTRSVKITWHCNSLKLILTWTCFQGFLHISFVANAISGIIFAERAGYYNSPYEFMNKFNATVVAVDRCHDYNCHFLQTFSVRIYIWFNQYQQSKFDKFN